MHCIKAIRAVIISIFKGWNLLTTTEKNLLGEEKTVEKKLTFLAKLYKKQGKLNFLL